MVSPTEQFGDFISQLPAGLFVMVCGSFLLLFMAFAWFAYFKPKRAQKTLAHRESATYDPLSNITAVPDHFTASAPAYTARNDLDTGELPDLDDLVDTSRLTDEVPSVAVPPVSSPSSPSLSQPAPAPIRDKNTYRVKLNTGAIIEAKEVVAILRDPRDGRLIVQIDDTGYRTLLDTSAVKQEFVKVMRELSEVVTEPDTNPPPIEEAIEPAEPEGREHIPTPPRSGSTTPPPPPAPDAAMPGDLPSYKLEDSLVPPQKGGLFTKPKYEPAPVPELNIAAAIEAYLKHKLKYTPEYVGRVIHVHSAPGGGVRIQVDNTFYEAVGDIADPEIREFLSATIQEWQDRQ